ncbi:unnamed protein product [Miscanthus lutarioriparius]|uniref:CRM domain-containing protein n=1 Tax=Miscanthus lutarioriparius TaxID=422564 RepID=A0A811NTT2_9POAL|nr:unnamed protein product [Miscanthus lutarioriparius]
MATRILSRQNLRKLVSLTLQNISQRQLISPYPPALRSTIASPSKFLSPLYLSGHSLAVRWATYGSVNLVLSDDGKPKFQIEEVEPSTKRRYLTKKRLKVQRKKEKKKRKEANKNDPRRIRPKGKKIKQKFPTPEARLKYKIEKVICKPCKPGQIQEYANEIARLSGGIPVNIIGDDTIVFYRGKNYVQPEVMSPIDTLSKKKALEKSKYEQSLETVRRFIAISEKELELYYRHVALYGNPQSQKADFVCGDDREASLLKMGGLDQGKDQEPHLATNQFSDLHICDVYESDEEDSSSSEYDVNDDETESMTSISEDAVVSDHDDLANWGEV